MQIRITKLLNTRIGGPHTSFKKGVVRIPGQEIPVLGTVQGENIGGNDLWYRAVDPADEYYWSGGAMEKDASLPPPPFAIDYATMFSGLGNEGAGIKVCILDSGYYDHYAFLGKIKNYKDFTATDGQCRDITGHGTHLAGLIGAEFSHPTLPVIGIAPACELLIGKVVPDQSGNNDVNFIIAGIDWAIAQNADVINLSLDVSIGQQLLAPAIKRAADANIMLIAAAGDVKGLNGRKVAYPASDFDHCISIAEVSLTYLQGNPDIEPKINYLSGWVNYLSTSLPQDQYFSEKKGSSIAAAFLSGLCARILSGWKNTGTGLTNINKARIINELNKMTVDKTQLNFSEDTLFKIARP